MLKQKKKEMKMKKNQNASGKKSDTRFETQNENSIDKVNIGAILSHVNHCLFKFVCYP